MRLVEEGKNLLLTQIKDFDIKQTLECGQCFNFIELADKDYAILAQGRDLRIKQEGHDLVFFDTDKKTMEEVWIPYFDLDRDYEAIKKDLLNMDPKLEVSIKALYGMRILRQDFFETLISFILSQNKQIPQIKACVRNISRLRGKEVEHGYLFPTYDEMKDISEEELKECKTGFRAGYVLSALDSYGKGLLDEDQLKAMVASFSIGGNSRKLDAALCRRYIGIGKGFCNQGSCEHLVDVHLHVFDGAGGR